jgi:hypothetical protein
MQGLQDLEPTLQELKGHVLLVGGLMARSWLHLRPVEGLPPRATADIDLGVDRQGLRLTAASTRIQTLLAQSDYHPQAGEETFRFEKQLGDGRTLMVDVLVPKGASREDPPILEKGIATLAAPGLAYAISRRPYFVNARFIDDDSEVQIELPLPALDAAFVLKGALVASGVRSRPDRRFRDRVDGVMLAAACLEDGAALAALQRARGREARKALEWLVGSLDSPTSAVAAAIESHFGAEYSIPGGAEWAVGVGERMSLAMADQS